MKTFRKSLCLSLAVILLLSCAQAEIFAVPAGIKSLESGAFSGISMPDGIVLPESLSFIAPDAFEDTFVYGISGGKAEAYAASRGLEFRPIDFGDVAIDVPAYASPYRPFAVRAGAESVLPYEILFKVYKDGELCCEASGTDEAEITLYEGGLYDYEVTLFNHYTSTQAYFEGETEIYDPVCLIKDTWFVREGESFCPIDETEERSVILESASDGVSISGHTVTAQRLGSYTVTAIADQHGENVYTDFTVNVVVPVETILLGEADIELYIGESFAPVVSVLPEEAQVYELSYVSTAPAVAQVDESGLITALAQGEAVIRIETFDAEAAITVRVKQRAEALSILPPEAGNVLLQGTSLRLDYSMLPDNTDDYTVEWSSSDESVLTVDSAGYVRALQPGSAVITAINERDGSIRDSIVFSVIQGTQSISANVPDWLYVGDSAQITVSAQPEEALYDISVSVSDPDILSYESDGTLRALSPGESSVTFTSADWVSASYAVKVYAPCTGIGSHLNEINLNPGMSANANDLFFPEPADCLSGEMAFSSSDESVVSVSDGGVLSALAAGTATVTATMGELSAAMTVNVVTDGKVVSSLSVSSSYLVLKNGETGTISPVLGDAAGKYKRGDWYSDAEDIACITNVSSNGTATVKGLRPGTAHVYLLSSSGMSAVCEVLVNPVAIRTLSLKTKTFTLDKGETAQIELTVSPADADLSDLYLYSSNPAVAEVSQDGIITAVGAGECEIFVRADDKAASCRVKVNSLRMENAWLCESEYCGMAGESTSICYYYTPENASPAAFSWTSENADIASVDDLSGTVFFKAAGETDLHGVARDGSGLTLTLHIVVEEIPVRALTLSREEMTLRAGESDLIFYSVYPYNASYGTAVFESADESVATVDENGRVTAVRSGETEIFVSVGRGESLITRTVRVNVERTNDVQYRALIMGQFTVPGSRGYLPFSLNCTRGVYDALSQSTIDASGYSIRFIPENPSIESVRTALRGIAEQTDEDDITVVYLLTHGSYSENLGYYMQFANGTEYYANTILTDVEKLSGHVVLVLIGCHSGRALQCSEVAKLRASGGVYTGLNGTGHLSIICSSTDTTSTYYDVTNTSQAYDFFSKAFTQALGWDLIADCRMSVLADSDHDRGVTLTELFDFVRPRTQSLISSYIQLHGTANFHGNPLQYPSCFIAGGEEDLLLFRR